MKRKDLKPLNIVDSKDEYSHRNGETEPPTEAGWYWLGYSDMVCDIDMLGKNGKWFRRGGNDRGVRYYGPIPEPKR